VLAAFSIVRNSARAPSSLQGGNECVHPFRRHSSTCKGLKLTVQVECTAEAGISPQKMEELKVALRELGMDDEVRSHESRRDLVCNPAIGPNESDPTTRLER
jgi:hypothetical protein